MLENCTQCWRMIEEEAVNTNICNKSELGLAWPGNLPQVWGIRMKKANAKEIVKGKSNFDLRLQLIIWGINSTVQYHFSSVSCHFALFLLALLQLHHNNLNSAENTLLVLFSRHWWRSLITSGYTGEKSSSWIARLHGSRFNLKLTQCLRVCVQIYFIWSWQAAEPKSLSSQISLSFSLKLDNFSGLPFKMTVRSSSRIAQKISVRTLKLRKN